MEEDMDWAIMVCVGRWERLVTRARPLVPTFVTTITIWASLIVVQSLYLVPRGILGSGVELLVIVWPALSLSMAVDPLFPNKLAALKDVAQILPILGKKEE